MLLQALPQSLDAADEDTFGDVAAGSSPWMRPMRNECGRACSNIAKSFFSSHVSNYRSTRGVSDVITSRRSLRWKNCSGTNSFSRTETSATSRHSLRTRQSVCTSALIGMRVLTLPHRLRCGPCRSFTPQLVAFYNALKAKGKSFEIVFVSSDRDDAAFQGYLSEMPWKALPFADRKRKAKLSGKFGVSGIPTLVLLTNEGKVITKDARSRVMSDPEGTDFPWVPKPISELLQGGFVDASGNARGFEELSGKVVGLYFSAHWCGPCRSFTPQLVATYQKIKAAADKPFEIVFVSSDRDENAFKEYLSEMPWLALPFSNRASKEALSQRMGVQGIPTLVILDETLKVVTLEGRAALGNDPDGEMYPWKPLPISELSGATAQALNSTAGLIVFTDNFTDASTCERVVAKVSDIAREEAEALEKSGEDRELCFYIAKKDPIVARVLALTGTTATKPLVVLLDIPMGGSYVMTSDESAVSDEQLEAFLQGYRDESLELTPLHG